MTPHATLLLAAFASDPCAEAAAAPLPQFGMEPEAREDDCHAFRRAWTSGRAWVGVGLGGAGVSSLGAYGLASDDVGTRIAGGVGVGSGGLVVIVGAPVGLVEAGRAAEHLAAGGHPVTRAPEVLGWVSLGLGVTSLVVGIREETQGRDDARGFLLAAPFLAGGAVLGAGVQLSVDRHGAATLGWMTASGPAEAPWTYGP